MRGLRRSAWVRVAATIGALAVLIGTLPAITWAQDGRASVRVIHGVSDAGPIDLYIDGAIAVVGASFPSVTDPLDIEGGEHRIVVAPSGSGPDAALVDSTLTIDAGTTAEIAVVGGLTGLNAVLFAVDRSPLADGEARIRIVHASPDAGSIDPVIVDADALFPSIDYLLATEYVEVAAGGYSLELRLADDETEPLTVPDLEIEADTVTDVYVVGQVGDGTLQPLLVGARAQEGEPVVVEEPADEAPPLDADPAIDADADAGAGAASAVAESLPGPVSLRAGTCAELGNEVAPIAEVAAASGAEVGPQGGPAIGNGFATIPVAFEAIVAAEHAIVVGGDDAPTACGEVGGRLTEDGALAVPLLAGNGAPRGVAVLYPNVLDPTTTDVSVFVVPRLVAEGGTTDDETDETAAPDSAAESPVSVTIEAVGTPTGTADTAVEQAGA
jgi:hypothetical protein